jgi:hypothetical protein
MGAIIVAARTGGVANIGDRRPIGEGRVFRLDSAACFLALLPFLR